MLIFLSVDWRQSQVGALELFSVLNTFDGFKTFEAEVVRLKDYGNILQFVRSGKYLLALKILKVSFAMFKLFVNISPSTRFNFKCKRCMYEIIKQFHRFQRKYVSYEQLGVRVSAPKISIRRFVITEKAPTRAFSWLKVATTTFTFKTLLRHYAKQALTPRSLLST